MIHCYCVDSWIQFFLLLVCLVMSSTLSILLATLSMLPLSRLLLWSCFPCHLFTLIHCIINVWWRLLTVWSFSAESAGDLQTINGVQSVLWAPHIFHGVVFAWFKLQDRRQTLRVGIYFLNPRPPRPSISKSCCHSLNALGAPARIEADCLDGMASQFSAHFAPQAALYRVQNLQPWKS